MQSSLEALESRIAPASIALGTGTTPMGDTTLEAADTLSATLNDVAGSGMLVVTGTVTINGATLALDVSELPDDRDSFVLIDNDDTDAITGTFADLPEGAVFQADGTYFKISYTGGDDSNDVTLTALVPRVTITGGGKIATFTDVDGDLVKLTTTAGSWANAVFELVPRGDLINGSQLASVKLDDSFEGANITITARGSFTDGGNGFVNVGLLDATDVDLGIVSVRGDLARIVAGDAARPAPAIKSLTVQSIGLLGDSTLGSPGTLDSDFVGRVAKLVVKGDVRGAELAASGGFGAINIGGSFVESTIASATDIGAIVIKHDIAGSSGAHSVISAYGRATEPVKGLDIAIKSLTVGGRVEWADIIAGATGTLRNADASIGAVKVSGDWIASNLTAGVSAGADGFIGTGDDASYDDGGGAFTVRDREGRDAQIASVRIGGQVLGTADTESDHFGIVAEWIKLATIGGQRVGLTFGPRSDADYFRIAPTGPGAGDFSDTALLEVLA